MSPFGNICNNEQCMVKAIYFYRWQEKAEATPQTLQLGATNLSQSCPVLAELLPLRFQLLHRVAVTGQLSDHLLRQHVAQLPVHRDICQVKAPKNA